MKIARNILTALSLTLFIISLSVVITLNLRPVYYFDIGYLDIPAQSGLSAEAIRANYDALIDYNSMFSRDELNFPTLTMSETGRIHFVEVKRIFVFIQYMAILTFLTSGALILFCRCKGERLYLKLTSIFTIALPTVLALCIGINWEKAFVTFHHIFFNNDYWIFDPLTDPVITILPDTYFFHCAALILIMIFLGSLIAFLLWRRKKTRSEKS